MMDERLLKELTKEPSVQLTHKEYLNQIEVESNISLRDRAATFLFRVYAGLLACTMLIFFLQGFKLFGFQLDQGLLHWLGAATVGEIAGLAATVYGALFKK